MDRLWRRVPEGQEASVKHHEGTTIHKEASNLQSNRSDMKEAVKTAVLQNDRLLLNLTSIILSMANDSQQPQLARFVLSLHGAWLLRC